VEKEELWNLSIKKFLLIVCTTGMSIPLL
jgi:hypothetical protein